MIVMSSQETRQDIDRLKSLIEASSDYLLWGSIILFFCALYGYFGLYLPQSKQQIITVAFKDANEINHGSIVRMMGSEIGYVDKVQLNNDHVDVTIKTFPGSPKIPSGSIFSIKFTGLVGAKSIEVTTTDGPIMRTPGKNPVYEVEEPIRMRESLEYQIDIAQALQRGAENFTDIFGKKKPLEEVEYNIHLSNTAVKKSNEALITTKHAFETAQNQFGRELAQVNRSVGNFAHASHEAAIITSEANFKYDTITNINKTLTGMIETHDALISIDNENKLSIVNQDISKVSHDIRNFSKELSISELGQNINTTIDNLDTFNQVMGSAQTYFDKDFTQPFAYIRNTIQTFNQKVVNLYDRWFGNQDDNNQTTP